MTDPLDDLLAQMPPADASEAEIESFMERVMNTPGGAELIHDFAGKITAGGSLDTMLKEEEAAVEKRSLKSPARFVIRVSLLGIEPLIWRRFSLPADCAYVHLHEAIQDAFGWEGRQDHRFEIWEEGQLEVSFSASEDGEDYCEVENRLIDLFRENVSEFQYLYDFQDKWRHRIVIENLVRAGLNGTRKELRPHLHTGERHGPPEDCGGPPGFAKFLQGEHPLCRKYEPEILAEFKTGHPDFEKITLR